MKTNPVKGMKDFLPEETRLRDYVRGVILDTYRSSGFERVSTPILEDMENLNKSEGGDNLNLIFKVLKRGEKLDEALESKDPDALCDMGLRYDLTLPLARFYAANREALPRVFKVIQTDRVYRAERPQKGRLREFVQCDIDILGDDSPQAEMELIDVTARALISLGFKGFTVNVNDRRILRGMLEGMGFVPASIESVCVSFDKLDKIGISGVCAELAEKGCPAEAVDCLKGWLEKGDLSLEAVGQYYSDAEVTSRVEGIVSTANALSEGNYTAVFDASLTRGQGYYTGCVFEIRLEGYPGAIAGGGRYDRMIGKFTGTDTPAVGFSIGFERICQILSEQGFSVPGEQRLALLYKDDAPFADVLIRAGELRRDYSVTLLKQKKLSKQLSQLESQGFSFAAFYDTGDIKPLGADKHNG
ncbi:MAG: histidine--tRNA ligase [Clostridiales bacterium]|nr:histidine--tRNA ligase [Clostridiales bacterium]